MKTRTFRFRLRSRHPAPDHATTDLELEFLSESGAWELQNPSLTTPGFRLYLLSLLLCQHFYLVANAREKHIPLEAVEGDFVVTTSADWILQAVEGDFRIRLDAAASRRIPRPGRRGRHRLHPGEDEAVPGLPQSAGGGEQAHRAGLCGLKQWGGRDWSAGWIGSIHPSPNPCV
jgi:hypothetical protein